MEAHKLSQKVHNSIDFEHFGQTLKFIRKLKGIKQQDLAQKCQIPLSTYRKIESDVSQPSTTTFFTILKKLNISLVEFSYIHSKENYFTKERFVYLFKDLLHTLNKNKLDNFIRTGKQYLKQHDDEDIQNIVMAVEASRLLDYEDNRSKGKEMCQRLFDKLNAKKNWFYWDALIAQTLIIHLDSESSYTLSYRARETFIYYDEMYPSKESRARVLLNLIYCFKLNNDILSSKPYVELALKETRPLREQYLYYDALYKKAELLLAEGQIREAKRYYSESRNGLKFLRENRFAQDNDTDWLEMLRQHAPHELQKNKKS